jgi:uncharacterized repeat protein (TIGR01451 family)
VARALRFVFLVTLALAAALPGLAAAQATADLSVTKMGFPDPARAGRGLTYNISVINAGPSNAATVTLSDTLPAGVTYQGSFLLPPTWTCVTPAVGSNGTISCTIASLAPGVVSFQFFVALPMLANGTLLSNTATVSSATSDPNLGNESATSTTTVLVDLENTVSVTKSDAPDPVIAGNNITYTITASNATGGNTSSAGITEFMLGGTTFVSLIVPAGWSCDGVPPVGGTGNFGCGIEPWPPGNAVFTVVVQVPASTAGGSVIDSQTNLYVANGSDLATRIDDTTTQVISPASLTGTKTVSGDTASGGAIVYTVAVSNSGPGTQGDNPGAEFTDVLPAGLTLVSATATSGAALATVGTNTVTWNGSIAASGSVTITINATINPGIAPGTTISNQGSFAYDADGNGTNEASGVTDSPATTPGGDPTTFQVAGGAAPLANIPTLDTVGLMLLALLLAMGGAAMLRRKRQA